MTAIGTPAMAR